ncbi:chalcone isomerase family protein [Desulforegula conservatrix]|uniref:chalcone isomerase family protein n=1 Tax=Desulforegula conservatrix TaxID=153026 RepID=UPI00042111BC|nr:chalcone isomerase family protein [Desulforegula conservatrix]
MKKLLSVLLVLLLTSSVAWAKKVGDYDVPDTLKAGSENLALNGAGFRTKIGMKLYVGSLYTQKPAKDEKAIIDADAPMAITLHIVSGMITSEKMMNAINEGFENSTGGNIAPLKKEIDTFISVFKTEIKEGDKQQFIYVPGTGVEIYKNGAKVNTIAGIAFKKALFGIWLCDKPADGDLKDAMLGK